MGVAGYNAEQEMELVKTQALRFQPDLIIIGYCVNDVAIGADMGLWRHFTRSGLRTWDFVKLRWIRLLERLSKEDIVQRSYQEIARLCKEKQVPVLVVIFPELQVVPTRENLRENKPMMDLCSRLGLTALDLYPIFKATDPDDHSNTNTTLEGVHPTALGHKIAGEEIFRFLQSHFLASAATNVVIHN